MSVWDKIWCHDSYSDPELRRIKAKYKVDMFKDLISINSNSVCVDVGCGGGYISKEVFNKYKCSLFSLDNSHTAIEYAKQNNQFDKMHYLVSPAQKMELPDAIADVVFCIGVLEHITDIDIALKEIDRIIKCGGRIVIITSNLYSSMFFDRLLKQLLGKWRYGYQKNWKLSKLKDKLKENGFSIYNFSVHQGFGDFEKKNKLDKIINKLIPTWGRYIQIIGGKE